MPYSITLLGLFTLESGMWYKTKDEEEVFNTKHNGCFYQLTNTHPNVGDYVLVSLEHDPVHIVRVKSFNPETSYPLNNDYKFGAWPDYDGGFYGVGTIRWSDNKQLEISYQKDRKDQFKYWSKKSDTSIEDF